MFLLFDTTSCGLAVLPMHNDRRTLVLIGVAITFLLGLGFISMEINEFYQIRDGNAPGRSGFLSAFFTLVGTHGTHVAFGLMWMAVMMDQIIGKGIMFLKTAVFQASLLGVAGTIVLWAETNGLSVAVVLTGLAIYVGMYTLYLKRSCVYGILIGSLAEAAPPLTGYCAVARLSKNTNI